MAEDAAEAYSANVAAEPRNGVWRAGLAQALSMIDAEKALTEARRAVHDAPTSALAWYSLSRAYRAGGNEHGELYALRASVTYRPVNPAPYVRLASVFRDHNRSDLGDRVIGWAEEEWPEDVTVKAWRTPIARP
jgi:predicted Zn-dependent protease